MSIKANQEAIVAALRSGKYHQGWGKLKGGGCHCVWGVICDISGQGQFAEGEDSGFLLADGTTAYAMPPKVVQDWAGFTEDTQFTIGVGSADLMWYNDTKTATFAEMADAIEAAITN